MKKHVLMGLMLLITATEEVNAQAGTLDQTFGSAGKVTSNFNLIDRGLDFDIQSDGKIIVVGSTSTNTISSNMLIARYNSNGSLDNTFGTNGILTSTALVNLSSVILQSDDKIVAVGMEGNTVSSKILVVRSNANGQFDNAFGTNGIVTYSIGAGLNVAKRVKLQTDGKIIIGCDYNYNNGNTREFAVIRLNTNGTLDNTFGTNGITTFTFNNLYASLWDLEIQTDGKIITSGVSQIGSNSYAYALARLDVNGALDNTFGNSGKTTAVFSGLDFGTNCTILPNGKILMVGSSLPQVGLVQFNQNGMIDNTFGNNGLKTLSIGGNGNNGGFDIVIQPDGRIIVVGKAHLASNSLQSKFGLSRLNANGTTDFSFGTNGIVTTSFGSSSGIETPYISKLQNDGKILLVGSSGNNGPGSILLARYNSDLYTGLTEQPTEDDYFVPYPNPFSNQITLNYTLQEPASITIDLLDITGKIILSNTEQSTSGRHKKEILLPDNIKTGVYFIKMKSKSFDRTYKLIKN
jgi:uncharacterized delta-60 repeat protein